MLRDRYEGLMVEYSGVYDILNDLFAIIWFSDALWI